MKKSLAIVLFFTVAAIVFILGIVGLNELNSLINPFKDIKYDTLSFANKVLLTIYSLAIFAIYFCWGYFLAKAVLAVYEDIK